MARRSKRFTIYDAMEEAGIFEANPANTFAVDPVTKQSIFVRAEYPKMLYHPLGEERITVPAEEVMTPFGPKRLNQQVELISRIVQTEGEEEKWLTQGWHSHPADAIGASGKTAPQRSSSETIEKLMAELKAKEAELLALGAVIKQGQAVGQTAAQIQSVGIGAPVKSMK